MLSFEFWGGYSKFSFTLKPTCVGGGMGGEGASDFSEITEQMQSSGPLEILHTYMYFQNIKFNFLYFFF